MAQELAEQHLVAGDRIGQQQQQRAALGLADDRVVGQQQGDQRHQEHGQAGEAHHGHRQLADLDRTGGRAAEQGQGERQHGQQQRRRQDPAVAQAVPDLLQRDHGHGRHDGVPWARKWPYSSSSAGGTMSTSSICGPSSPSRPQQLHLALGRAGDHQGPLVQPFRDQPMPEPFGDPPGLAQRHRDADLHRQPRLPPQVGQRPARDQPAALEDGDAIGARLHLAERMRGQEHGDAVARELADQLVERAAQRRVQARGRLVEQQQPRPAEQCLGQAQPLPHALGVGADATAGGRGEADALEQRLGRARRQPLEPGIEGQHLAAGHRGIEGDGLGQEAQLEPRLRRRQPRSGRQPASAPCPRSAAPDRAAAS